MDIEHGKFIKAYLDIEKKDTATVMEGKADIASFERIVSPSYQTKV